MVMLLVLPRGVPGHCGCGAHLRAMRLELRQHPGICPLGCSLWTLGRPPTLQPLSLPPSRWIPLLGRGTCVLGLCGSHQYLGLAP